MIEDVYTEKELCCGCGACMSACPHKAISMVSDKQGFEYPLIDGTRCIQCGLCQKICNFAKGTVSNNNILETYALQHKNKSVLYNSSSGGAFTAISDWVLCQEGIVFGAVFDARTYKVKHLSAECKEDRNKMRGSKYVQSSTGDIFLRIKSELKDGRLVLFTGTPCQCAGLYSFLQGHPENLIMVDILCHGVPSSKLLEDNITRIEKKYNKKITNYFYRSKRYGYEHTHEVVFIDGSAKCNVDIKRVLKLYLLGTRPSCFNCQYTNRHRYGDITIADMWDAPRIVGITDNLGTSTVLVNTGMGERIIREISNDCSLISVDPQVIKQAALSKRVKKPVQYEKFWKEYAENGYEYVLNRYAPRTIKSWGLYAAIKLAHFLHIKKNKACTKR